MNDLCTKSFELQENLPISDEYSADHSLRASSVELELQNLVLVLRRKRDRIRIEKSTTDRKKDQRCPVSLQQCCFSYQLRAAALRDLVLLVGVRVHLLLERHGPAAQPRCSGEK